MLERELYHQAYEQYRRWNEAEEMERIRCAGQISPQEAWRRYVELVEFCWKLCPQQSETQRREKLTALERYNGEGPVERWLEVVLRRAAWIPSVSATAQPDR